MAEVIEPGRSRIEDILLGEEDIEPGRSRIEDILLNLYQDLVHLGPDGKIPAELIPPQVFERMITVADDTARFALTTDDVQNGDWVYVNSTQSIYYIYDDTNLDSEAGYKPVAAGIAAKAIADQYGNVIDTTYAKDADLDALTTRVGANEDNISLVEQANGQKNIISNHTGWEVPAELAATLNSDGSITVVANTTSNKIMVVTTDLSSMLQEGTEYVLSGCDDGDFNATYALVISNSAYSSKVIEATGGTPFTANGTDHVNLALIVRGGQNWTKTFYPMICKKSLWEAGFTDYQPYAMSNAELTEKEKQNENNISSILANIDITEITDAFTIATGFTIDNKSHVYKQGKHIFGRLIIQSSNAYTVTPSIIVSATTYPPKNNITNAAFYDNTSWTCRTLGSYFFGSNGQMSCVCQTGTTDTYAHINLDYVIS